MAKSQRRSNREIRKPKKQKAYVKVETAFGSPAGNGNGEHRTTKK